MVDYDGVTRTYNAANQMVNDGTNTLAYDNNGNLWKTNSVVSHTWDRANRLLSHGGLNYAYEGTGARISQDNGVDVTTYLLDVQPSLVKVLSETVGANTDYVVHSPRGIHAHKVGSDWLYHVPDALHSVRGLVDANGAVSQSISYSSYGIPDTSVSGFAFTGEMRDTNGLQYHRARYYDANLGIFPSLDPVEYTNRYWYANANPIRYTDPSGKCIFAGIDTSLCVAVGALVLISGATLVAGATIGTGNTSLSNYQVRVPNVGRGLSNFWENVCVPGLQILGAMAASTFPEPMIYDDYAPPIPAPQAPDVITDTRVNERYPTFEEQGIIVVEPANNPEPSQEPVPQPDYPVPPVGTPDTDDDNNVVQIFRGVDGKKRKNNVAYPLLSQREFTPRPGIDDDGLSLFELQNLPASDRNPYAYPFSVSYSGEKIPHVTGVLLEVPTCTGTYTPEHSEGHWSVNCAGDTGVQLSTYASAIENRDRTILYPLYTNRRANDRRFEWPD